MMPMIIKNHNIEYISNYLDIFNKILFYGIDYKVFSLKDNY